MPSIEDGGVEKNLFLISNFFIKKINNISIITISNKFKNKFDKKIKLIFFRNNFFNYFGRRKKFFLCLFLLFLEILKDKNILVFSFQGNIYCTLLCKILGVKVIVRSNTSPEGWSQNIFKHFFFKTILSSANKIIVNSIDFKKQFKKRYNIKATCIYNPLNKKEILNKSKEKTQSYFGKNCLKIINVGRLIDQKDQMTLIKAINLIKEKIKINALIVGNGKEKNNLLSFIKKKKLNKIIKIISYKKNPYPLIKHSDIFILSSIYEGLPNVLLEAICLKKFIISSNCPTGPREILDNGKGGLLFKSKNHRELAKKIIYFHKNKKKFFIMNKNSQLGLERFNFNKNLNKYYEIIRTEI
mgnify:FL=1